jgi:hypothetical protein
MRAPHPAELGRSSLSGSKLPLARFESSTESRPLQLRIVTLPHAGNAQSSRKGLIRGHPNVFYQ